VSTVPVMTTPVLVRLDSSPPTLATAPVSRRAVCLTTVPLVATAPLSACCLPDERSTRCHTPCHRARGLLEKGASRGHAACQQSRHLPGSDTRTGNRAGQRPRCLTAERARCCERAGDGTEEGPDTSNDACRLSVCRSVCAPWPHEDSRRRQTPGHGSRHGRVSLPAVASVLVSVRAVCLLRAARRRKRSADTPQEGANPRQRARCCQCPGQQCVPCSW
jgi:hypothetical protein